jgi:hypothetical protein
MSSFSGACLKENQLALLNRSLMLWMRKSKLRIIATQRESNLNKLSLKAIIKQATINKPPSKSHHQRVALFLEWTYSLSMFRTSTSLVFNLCSSLQSGLLQSLLLLR